MTDFYDDTNFFESAERYSGSHLSAIYTRNLAPNPLVHGVGLN
jgi:hypothetical protein